MRDIQFKDSTGAFNCRVVGVLKKGSKILLSTGVNDDFWTFIGGKATFGESTADGVLREYREETGASLSVDHLVAVIENFFQYNSEDWHQFIFFYLLKDGEDVIELFDGERSVNDDDACFYRWFDLSEIDSLTLKPECMYSLLHRLDEKNLHIINKD